MVGNEHRAARPQQPVHLGERELGSRDVVQRARRAGEIERAALVRQRGRVRLDELDVRGRPLAALVDQLRDDVDADDLAHERRESDRERAGADIERALLAVSVSRWRSRSCVAAVRRSCCCATSSAVSPKPSERRLTSSSASSLVGIVPAARASAISSGTRPCGVPKFGSVARNAPICRRNRIYEPLRPEEREHVAHGEIEQRQEHARPPNRRQRPRLGWQAPLGRPPRLGGEVVLPVASSCLSPEGYCP